MSDAALEMRTKWGWVQGLACHHLSDQGRGVCQLAEARHDLLQLINVLQRNPWRISNGATIPILAIFLSNEISKFKEGAIQKRRCGVDDGVGVVHE
eukprot:11774481-Ditylum_brightwellii.AAC.1